MTYPTTCTCRDQDPRGFGPDPDCPVDGDLDHVATPPLVESHVGRTAMVIAERLIAVGWTYDAEGENEHRDRLYAEATTELAAVFGQADAEWVVNLAAWYGRTVESAMRQRLAR